jgi:hypothetical protein
MSGINKRSIKLLRAKSVEANSESATMREIHRIIVRDGFQYFAVE